MSKTNDLMEEERPSTAPEEGDNYDSSKLGKLEGLEAVRKKPGMYIGGTDERALHHCVSEVLDNSVDEHLAGYCTRIDVAIEIDEEHGVCPARIDALGNSSPEPRCETRHSGAGRQAGTRNPDSSRVRTLAKKAGFRVRAVARPGMTNSMSRQRPSVVGPRMHVGGAL